MNTIRPFRNEKWKLFEHDDYDISRYIIKISNYGRIKRRKPEEENFVLLKKSYINNFEVIVFPSLTKLTKYGTKSSRSVYLHKIVAELFIDKSVERKKFVIHLDHDLLNNYVENLKYVNQKELTAHQLTNPKRIEADKNKIKYSKLTETRVKLLKRKLNDPNRRTRLKILAKQFGVSEMQLHRIKTGENWGHVTEY